MKTLNAKRITTLVAGAALLGLGLAFAGPITFQNVPIISNSGQPVAQIVIGSTAKPIDGVTAANIAAAIGNLAYTSVPVTASVNATQAQSVLTVNVNAASYTLSNPQIWLNQTGKVSAAAGTYLFSTLIGSVINRGVTTGAPQNTKTLQGTATSYAYNDVALFQLTISPAQSPYTDSPSGVPFRTTPNAASNGGGITFQGFSTASGAGDNILQISHSQLPGLLNNAGSNGETESLWITGFPVYNQTNNKPPGTFSILSAGGAYEALFNKPIANTVSNGGVNQASFTMVGANWTILHYYNIPTGTVSGGITARPGGKIQLAASLSPQTTVYVGHNLTAQGSPFVVQLTDLGQPNSNGVSPASLNIYYNNVLTNTSQVYPGTTALYNVSGHNLYVNVNQTFAGLYAYQKWAKMQLYSNVWNVTSGTTFNQTNDKNWTAILEWTNRSSGTVPDALASIIIYGTSQQVRNLVPGQSMTWITQPAAWKATFTGDTLTGSGNFDSVTFTSSNVGQEFYKNGAGTVQTPQVCQLAANVWTCAGAQSVNTTAINESAAELVLTSQIPNAFTGYGSQSSQVKEDLTPWTLTASNAANSLTTNAASATVNVILTFAQGQVANYVTVSQPLYVTVGGDAQKSAVSKQFSFNGTTNTISENNVFFDNISSIFVQRPIPGLSVTVNAVSTSGNQITMATLAPASSVPTILYPLTGKQYQNTAAGTTLQYNQQNGQAYSTWTLNQAEVANAGIVGKVAQYFVFNAVEYPVYPYSTSLTDNVEFGLVNTTGGISGEAAGPFFQLNYSVASAPGADHGQNNNVTYQSSASGFPLGPNMVNAQTGFVTERGSKVTGVSPGTITVGFAKAVDTLQVLVGPSSTTNGVSGSATLCPGAGLPGIGVGQSLSVCGIANTTLAKVTSNITVAPGATFTIAGIGNIKAVPSVTSATTPVWLKNLSSTAPIATLDSQANTGSNLILIGSGFVNSLSAQLQAAYNISMTPTTQLAQAYGSNRVLIAGYYGNQTNAAGNSFIQSLYAQAST